MTASELARELARPAPLAEAFAQRLRELAMRDRALDRLADELREASMLTQRMERAGRYAAWIGARMR
jgi:hypothetical protein